MQHCSLQLQMKCKGQWGQGDQDTSPPNKLLCQFTSSSLQTNKQQQKKTPKYLKSKNETWNTESQQFSRVKQGTRWRYAEKKRRRGGLSTPVSFSVLDITVLGVLVTSQVSPLILKTQLYQKQGQFGDHNLLPHTKHLISMDGIIASTATSIE